MMDPTILSILNGSFRDERLDARLEKTYNTRLTTTYHTHFITSSRKLYNNNNTIQYNQIYFNFRTGQKLNV